MTEPKVAYTPEGRGQPTFMRVNSGDSRTINRPVREDRPRPSPGRGSVVQRDVQRPGWFGNGIASRRPGPSSGMIIRLSR